MSNNNRISKKFNTLDVIKGILIFAIVILHSKDTFNECIKGFRLFYNYGGYIVNTFFFAASGFGICYGYRNVIAEGKVSFFGFVLTRLKKFYPMYIITTAIMFFFTAHADGINFASAKEIILNVLCMSKGWFFNITPFSAQCWFLCVLFFIYILYWVIARLFGKNDIWAYVLFVVIGCVLMKLKLNIPFCYYDDGIGYASFFMGCIIAVFYTVYCRGKAETILLTMSFVIDAGLIYYLLVSGVFYREAIFEEVIFAVLIAPGILLFCLNPLINKAVDLMPILKDTFGIISMTVFFWHIIILRVFNAVWLKLSLYNSLGLKASYYIYLAATLVICYTITIIARRLKRS